MASSPGSGPFAGSGSAPHVILVPSVPSARIITQTCIYTRDMKCGWMVVNGETISSLLLVLHSNTDIRTGPTFLRSEKEYIFNTRMKIFTVSINTSSSAAELNFRKSALKILCLLLSSSLQTHQMFLY